MNGDNADQNQHPPSLPEHTTGSDEAHPGTASPLSLDITEISSSNLLGNSNTAENEDLDNSSSSNKDLEGQQLEVAEVAFDSLIRVEEAENQNILGTGDGSTTGEDNQEWLGDGDHEMKRVKVYELIGSRWMDQGTAFCFGQFQEETNEALLIARAESNCHEIILSTAIRSNDVYQRQQDTLIVWTEPDGVDYALSFQDPEGCSEVWNFILEVQRHMNGGEEHLPLDSSPQTGSDPGSVTAAGIIRSGRLPQPQLGIIGEIERAIKTLSRTQPVKERICEYIQQEAYIKSLIDVMNQAEDLESIENLHALCSMMQTILMLNDHSMYEHILGDDIFFGVVGMLEYDPEFPAHKANYREFLHQTSRFHQPIPIHDEATQRKIHCTYRLQFLKDVVLARALDDSTFNVLNSCIIFNQIDIISHVQQDPTFLRDVVRLYVDDDMLSGGGPRKKDDAMDVDADSKDETKPNGVTSHELLSNPSADALMQPDKLPEEEVALRREVVLLIQQLCAMGKNVQLPARMALFRSLVDRGILFAVQWALALSEQDEASRPIINVAGEILGAILDHDLNGVRGHVLKQVVAIEKEREAGKKGAENAETILALLCKMLAQSRDLAVQCQVGDALRVLMEVQSPDSPESQTPGAAAVRLFSRGKDDPGTEKFLDFFYKHCIDVLFKPFNDLPGYKNIPDPVLSLTREKTNLYLYLCELLCNFALQHSFRSHFYMLSSNLSVKVASLLRAKDKHLRHGAFRFFRICTKLNNRNLQNHLVKNDIFKPILDLTLKESRRDNLVSSSCQEFFDNLRLENNKDLIKHCMTFHEAEIRKLAETPLGGTRFMAFIRRWEMNNEPLPVEEAKPDKLPDIRAWPGPGRLLEAEEEDYFNTDDDEEDYVPPISSHWTRGPLSTLKRKRRGAVANISKGLRHPNITALRPPLAGLVDYDDDDDGEFIGPLPVDPLVLSPAPAEDVRRHTGASPAVIRIPPSPKPTHREIQGTATATLTPPQRPVDEDPEDSLLESLVRGNSSSPLSIPLSPGTEMAFAGGVQKRRREDEDDGLLERLSKAKKQDVDPAKEGQMQARAKARTGDEQPKKFKMKLGSTSLGIGAKRSGGDPSPSETGAKDGDTG